MALLGGCSSGSGGIFGSAAASTARLIGDAFVVSEIARFDEPWAMTFLPDGRLLVTEKRGALKVSPHRRAAAAKSKACRKSPMAGRAASATWFSIRLSQPTAWST